MLAKPIYLSETQITISQPENCWRKSIVMGNGSCEEHKRFKKGYCSFCNVCRYCEPLQTCSNKANHINWKRKAKRLGQCVEPRTPTTRTLNGSTACSSNSTQRRRGKRSSSLRGKRRRIVNEEVDDDDICRDAEAKKSCNFFHKSDISILISPGWMERPTATICGFIATNPKL